MQLEDFKLNRQGLSRVLGELEAEIMELIWQNNLTTVRDVYEELRKKKKIAYTTVMTIMGRLAGKGLLQIDKQGTAYIYNPVISKEQFEQETVKRVLDSALDFNNKGVVNYFVEKVKANQMDEELLSQLEELLKKAKEGQ